MFLLLVKSSVHTLRGSEKSDHRAVFNLTIGLHNMLHHCRTHINAGTHVLAKYQVVVRKNDTFVSELNPFPSAKYAEWAYVCSLTTTILGMLPSN